MGNLGSLLETIKSAITDHVEQGGHQNFDTGGLLGKITDLFRNHEASNGTLPASRDRYGDPADQGRANVRPASQDPYGDPADQGRR